MLQTLCSSLSQRCFNELCMATEKKQPQTPFKKELKPCKHTSVTAQKNKRSVHKEKEKTSTLLPHSHTPELLTPGRIDPRLWQIPAPPSARWGIKLDLWDQMECFSPLNHPLFGANVPAVVPVLLLVTLRGLLKAVSYLLSVLTGYPLWCFVTLHCRRSF